MLNKSYRVIFDDEYLLAVDKRAKLPMHRDRKNKFGFIDVLERDFNQKLFPCHRLDRQTSGIVLFSKQSSLAKDIHRQFRQGQITKEYIALVQGLMDKKYGQLRGNIKSYWAKRYHGKEKFAVTYYRVFAQAYNLSLLILKPLSGRTHQLRIQLALSDRPILGDRMYARGKDFQVKFPRLALHAMLLVFQHPVSKSKVKLVAELPLDMVEFINKHFSQKLASKLITYFHNH